MTFPREVRLGLKETVDANKVFFFHGSVELHLSATPLLLKVDSLVFDLQIFKVHEFDFPNQIVDLLRQRLLIVDRLKLLFVLELFALANVGRDQRVQSIVLHLLFLLVDFRLHERHVRVHCGVSSLLLRLLLLYYISVLLIVHFVEFGADGSLIVVERFLSEGAIAFLWGFVLNHVLGWLFWLVALDCEFELARLVGFLHFCLHGGALHYGLLRSLVRFGWLFLFYDGHCNFFLDDFEVCTTCRRNMLVTCLFNLFLKPVVEVLIRHNFNLAALWSFLLRCNLHRHSWFTLVLHFESRGARRSTG